MIGTENSPVIKLVDSEKKKRKKGKKERERRFTNQARSFVKLGKAVSRAGDHAEKLWEGVHGVDDLRDKEQKHGLAEVAQNTHHREGHAGKVAERVTNKHLPCALALFVLHTREGYVDKLTIYENCLHFLCGTREG